MLLRLGHGVILALQPSKIAGLPPRSPRSEGGFRRYGQNDLEALAFVRRVQGLGFKPSEIRGLLRLRGNRMQPCALVQRRFCSCAEQAAARVPVCEDPEVSAARLPLLP